MSGTTPIQRAISKLRGELESLRADLAKAQDERDQLASSPATLAEVKARVDAFVSERAAAYAPNVGAFCAPGFTSAGFTLVPAGPGQIEHALCAISGDRVRELLTAAAKQHLLRHGPGISSEQRAAGLADLNERLRGLEVKEESLICEAGLSGIDLERRPDASPEIVLEAVE